MKTIYYTVPVCALLDEDGEVVSVHVLDDEVRLDKTQPDGVTTADIAAAENAEWPSWEFGW